MTLNHSIKQILIDTVYIKIIVCLSSPVYKYKALNYHYLKSVFYTGFHKLALTIVRIFINFNKQHYYQRNFSI
jgi:hypothetical protein